MAEPKNVPVNPLPSPSQTISSSGRLGLAFLSVVILSLHTSLDDRAAVSLLAVEGGESSIRETITGFKDKHQGKYVEIGQFVFQKRFVDEHVEVARQYGFRYAVAPVPLLGIQQLSGIPYLIAVFPFQILQLVQDPVGRFTKTTIQAVSVALEQVVDVFQCHLSVSSLLTCRTDLANLHSL